MSISCTGCAAGATIQLRWDIHAKSNYRVTKTVFPRDIPIDVGMLLENSESLKNKINELKSLALKTSTFPINLEMIPAKNSNIDVLAKTANIQYTTPASDKDELRRRKMQNKMIGVVQLNTSINQYGKVQHPYLKQQQYNLVTELFLFPDHPVTVGEKWQLPVTLTSLNTPFLADKTQRVNKVWVNSIEDKPGIGKVAEIVYLIEEKIEGNRQQLVTDTPSPFEVNSSYFAVGEYQIDARKWLRYVGRLETTVGSIRNVNLIALVPSNEGAPR